MMVLEEAHDGDNTAGRHQYLQFVSGRELDLLDILGQAFGHVLAEVGQVLPLDRVKLPDRGCKQGRII